MKVYNKHNIPLARRLRKAMTPEERKLWHLFLKTYPVRFRRQAAIEDYIVDFYCAQAKLVVEIDGSQHFESRSQEYDAVRTNHLNQLGLQVLRISNRQINEDFDGVCQHIDLTIKNHI